ncbi:MAG: MATE family efflux transporter [Fimbriimonadaceae bacterium]|nr:MATE family efflux transporter [Fimbriimonadaceae bacterium]
MQAESRLPGEGLRRPEPPAWQVLWVLAWPAVLLNLLQTANSLLDGFFVGSLQPEALTALGGASPLIFLFGSLTFMLGTAATALVSRFFGAQDFNPMKEAAERSLSLSLYIGVGLTLAAMATAWGAPRLLLPPEDETAIRLMSGYLTIVAASLPALCLIQTLAGALRGIGDTLSPMILSGAQILLHMILNWIFIFPDHRLGPITLPGLNMGLNGAALALTLSAWVAALAYAGFAARSRLGARLGVRWPGIEWARRILRIAVPSGVLSIVRVTSLLAFTFILARVPDGSAAVAAMRLGFSIEALCYMPAFGLSMAAAALVGQSLGMQDPDRGSRLGWLAGHHAAVVSTVVAVALMIFAVPIATAMVPSQPDVARVAAHYMWFVLATETFFAYAMVMQGAMQGAGDTVTPLWITLGSMWLARVPMAAVFALTTLEIGPISIPGFGMGADGCWLALSVTQVISGVWAMWAFKAGRWRTVKV